MTTDEIIDAVLAREGSAYTNRPSDRGGPTRWGITQATLAAWRGRPVTPPEVERLEQAEARAIYRRRYIEDPGFLKVSDGRLRALLVDFGVHSGPRTAIEALQEALGVYVDGVFGSGTRKALEAADAAAVYRRVFALRWQLLEALALTEQPVRDLLRTHPHLQLHHLRGWMNRLRELLP